MSSFNRITRRKRIGANIIITTPHHHRIFSLFDWNLNGYKAHELAHSHDFSTAEKLAEILQ